MRVEIQRRYFFVDSEIVRCMIAKQSHTFATFVAVRLGEIHQSTTVDEWHWINTTDNVADWIIRGKTPSELHISGCWQNGPSFLSLKQNGQLRRLLSEEN